MKRLLFSLAVVCYTLQAAGQYSVSGRVTDEEKQPLQHASVVITENGRGTTTDSEGRFSISAVEAGFYTVSISYVGYETVAIPVEVRGDLELEPLSLPGAAVVVEEVVVSSIRAGEETPVAFVDVSRDEIKTRNFGQDIPTLLSHVPSMVTTSDAGNGIGYSSMRIRGTDMNRINVTINGIPLNDAETHSVFWVDLPELAASAEQIQVQRGIGTSTNGAAAFGASVNIQTIASAAAPYVELESTAGSFNTFRNNISAGTGLINDRFSVDMRLSDVRSDGFIDRSWVELQSYFISAGYHDRKNSLKFLTFGGFEELYQSWGGVPSALLETNRTYNGMGMYTDISGEVQFYENQIDHFDQVHYQLHYSRKFGQQLRANLSGHYTRGSGYYEEFVPENDPFGESYYSFYNLSAPVIGGDTLRQSDFIRRKWVENDFFGAIGSVEYEHDRMNIIAGGGWNRYVGDHFGVVRWARVMGENVLNHRWYEGAGDKQDWNGYVKTYYQAGGGVTAFLDLQLRGIRHLIGGTDAFSRDVTGDHEFLFFNPKAGLSFLAAANHRLYASVARAGREPNRNNYTDAPGGSEPVHETMLNLEAGYDFRLGRFSGKVNLYYMDYDNQLVLTGQINDVGYPIMTNVKDSYRTGIEFEAAADLFNDLKWNGHLTLSRNKILNFTGHVDNFDYWTDMENEPVQVVSELGTTDLAFSPAVTGGSQLSYTAFDRLSLVLDSRYVGRQYVDNTASDLYSIDPYFVNDLIVSMALDVPRVKEFSIQLKIGNLLNEQYETNAWVYRYFSGGEEYATDGYYPQAGTHFMAGIRLKL